MSFFQLKLKECARVPTRTSGSRRNDTLCCSCLKKKWISILIYETTIYRQLLEEYYNIPVNQETEFDEEFHARVFVDSDMQQIVQLLQLTILERNHQLVMQDNKIGTKTTMN